MAPSRRIFTAGDHAGGAVDSSSKQTEAVKSNSKPDKGLITIDPLQPVVCQVGRG